MDVGGGGRARHPAADSTATPAKTKKKQSPEDTTTQEKTKALHSRRAVDGMDDDVPMAKEGTTTKRMYERDEYEADREMDKMFKCNYWEDPACVVDLQRDGLELARNAALDNLNERAHRDTAVLLAKLKLRDKAQPAAGS